MNPQAALLKNTSDLVIGLSASYTIQLLSDRAANFYQWNVSNTVGKNFFALFANMKTPAPISLELLETHPEQDIFTTTHRYGGPCTINWKISPLEDNHVCFLLTGSLTYPANTHKNLHTHLSIITLATHGIKRHLPKLLQTYQLAKQVNQAIPFIPKLQLRLLCEAPDRIIEELQHMQDLILFDRKPG